MKNLVLLLSLFAFVRWASCHGHSHDDHDHHDHSHHHHEPQEPPSYKYSKAANEKVVKEHHHHDHDHGHHEEHDHHHGHKENGDKSSLWTYAMGSTLLVSAAPYLLLHLVPVDGSIEKKPLLKVLLAFASGGLLGDAFLHLIPHASAPHGHGHSHEQNHDAGNLHMDHGHDSTVGLGVLCGIVAFLTIEKVIRGVNGGHGHSHSKAKPEKKDKKVKKQHEMKVSGYLNLAADFVHNFTDGLAVGASYAAGNTVGYVTTATILLHEIPHEIGDFAVLLQSGCSRRKAMALQLLTAVGAIAGTALSLVLEDNFESFTAWILPFTAGGFIYIATVTVIPELLEDTNTKYTQSLKEILALIAGVGMMVLIADLE